MTERDVLNHPDLSKAWVTLESAAPTVDWDDLNTSLSGPKRARISFRRIAVIAALALWVVFLGSETVGVFAARRAMASGSAVSNVSVQFELSTLDVSRPETLLGYDAEEVGVDLSVTSSMILASVHNISDPSSDSSWYDLLARLSPAGWEPLDVGLDVVVDSTFVAGRQVLLGFSEMPEMENGHETVDRDYVVYEIPSGSARSQLLHVFDAATADTDFLTISGSADGFVVASSTGGSLQLWHSTDGETWTTEERFASGAVNSSTTMGDERLFVGYDSGLVPYEEFGTHAIWTQTDGETPQQVDITGLRSQGFGYVIGGFRLSDGLEDIVVYDGGVVAYTGYLQIWDGFADGISLDPREAWSSLVVTSVDGITWDSHLLSDFAINQIIPFGDGLLATGARRPDSDTRTVEAEDGTTYETAVIPTPTLYYSEDGLTWHPVENSPQFTKPLLIQTGDGQAIAVDENTAEDRASETTTIHQITAP